MKKSSDKNIETKKKTPRFHMEMEGSTSGFSLLIGGVRRIDEYSSETLMLKIAGGHMHLTGQALCLTVFENKTVEVCGKLLEVKFTYDRN